MRKDKSTEFESKNTVNAPDERFQSEQVTDQAIKANTTVTPKTDFDVKENKIPGSQLKQEVAATIIGKKVGAGSASSSQVISAAKAGLKSGSYSGDAGTLLGSAANTPIMEKESQGGSRVDKRLSDSNKDINFLASEQYATEFQNIAPLSEDKSTVGYNGNPMNISARSQKTSGHVPAEILYDRSLDEIRMDKIIFTNGQTVKEAGVVTKDYPIYTRKIDPVTGRYQKTQFTDGKQPIRGNFAPKEIEVKVKKDNTGTFISSFQVLEDDLSINDADYNTVNNSSVNYKVDLNEAELARQRIDANAGSPSNEFYNPLGRSTDEPTATVMYLRDREAATGATMAAALRFALKSRAYYLSRTGKDGQDLITPAIDALYGHLVGSKDPAELRSLINIAPDGEISNTTANRNGSADILLHVFDSIKKYKTKADIVNQPRGLKLALSAGLNNHTPFRYKPEFLKALNANDFFSTIDRGYDPSSVTFVTDGVRLVYPYSLARSLKYTREHAGDDRTYDSELFTYAFQAGKGNQTYIVKVADPILNGVAWFLEQHASSLYAACGGSGNGEVTLHIPTIHYGAHFGLWDLLLCASAAYIEYERTNAFKDVLDYEDHYGYPFPEFETISEDAVRTPKNYGRISEYERLTVEQMKPEDAIRVIMPEIMSKIGSQDALLPFYFNECQFALSGSGSSAKVAMTESCQFSTPVIRSGVRLAYLDDFFGMEPKDVLLSYDIMTCFPGDHTLGTEHAGYVYKYSKTNDGLILAHNIHNLTVLDYLSTPRQLGWFCDAPAGYCRAIKSANTIHAPGVTSTDKVLNLANSSYARAYFGLKAKPTAILSDAALSIDRGQAFTQSWADSCANSVEGKSTNFDIMMAIGELFTISNDKLVFEVGKSTFSPFVAGSAESTYSGLSVNGIMAAFWTRIQKLPFVINPFDNAVSETLYDPYDFAYMFGLAGFLAADYNEEKYNRINAYQDQMFGFVKDPYIESSPIFK